MTPGAARLLVSADHAQINRMMQFLTGDFDLRSGANYAWKTNKIRRSRWDKTNAKAVRLRNDFMILWRGIATA